jgi:hypothetical protein
VLWVLHSVPIQPACSSVYQDGILQHCTWLLAAVLAVLQVNYAPSPSPSWAQSLPSDGGEGEGTEITSVMQAAQLDPRYHVSCPRTLLDSCLTATCGLLLACDRGSQP